MKIHSTISILMFNVLFGCSVLLTNTGCKQEERFYVASNNDKTYRIDKKTGETWLIKRDGTFKEVELNDKDNELISPEEYFDIVNNSFVLPKYIDEYNNCIICNSSQSRRNHTTEDCLKWALNRDKTSFVRKSGWKITLELSDRIYLEYNWDSDGVRKYFPVYVDINNNEVFADRNKTKIGAINVITQIDSVPPLTFSANEQLVRIHTFELEEFKSITKGNFEYIAPLN